MMKPRSAGCRRQDIFDYSRERYGTEPEALWATAPDYAVLRRADNHKWYALILRIPRKKVGLPGEDLIDVLEIKRDPAFASEEIDGIPVLPPYHMNKLHWIALPLDGSMPMETARFMLDLSYTLTGPKRRSASPKKRSTIGWSQQIRSILTLKRPFGKINRSSGSSQAGSPSAIWSISMWRRRSLNLLSVSCNRGGPSL